MGIFFCCKQCDHFWQARVEHPKYCPKCARLDWMVEKVDKIKIKRIKKKAGHQRKYNIQNLELGCDVILPWVLNSFGVLDTSKNESMNRCIRQEEKRTGKKFERMPTASGLRVIRVK